MTSAGRPAPGSIEVDLTFDVDETSPVPALHEIATVASVEALAAHHLEVVYYDTLDLALTARHVTLMRRTGGTAPGWYLTTAAADSSRREYQAALDVTGDAGSEPNDIVPEHLLTYVRVSARDHPLVPIVRVHTTRTAFLLHGKHRQVLARFSDDRVRAERLLDEPLWCGWREWSLETVAGTKTVLDSARAVCEAQGAHPSMHPPTLERALGDRMPLPTPGPSRSAKRQASTVLLDYLNEHVRALYEQDARVRNDAPGSVHKMRTSTRRLRSALASYRSLLAAETGDRLRGELRWLAGVLGTARDAEVLHERLRGEVAEVATRPGDRVNSAPTTSPDAHTIDVLLGDHAQSAQLTVLDVLNSERYFRLLDALDELLANPPLSNKAHQPARRVARDEIDGNVTRLRRAVRAAGALPSGSPRDEALHEVRKRAKRLRYAAEAAATADPTRASRMVSLAESLQEVLGEHQDSVVARRALRRLGSEAHARGEDAFDLGRLHALEEVRASAAEERFRRVWRTLLRAV